NNANLTTISHLSNLTSLGSYLSFYNNAQLASLDGLGGLTSINGYIWILTNQSLVNLNGLSNVASISGFLTISDNELMSDISGISQINSTSITNMNIKDNPILSICDYPNICTYLEGIGTRNVSGNAVGCDSDTAIQAACSGEEEEDKDDDGPAPVCTGNITLTTQAQVNDFNCSKVVGDLTISGNDITNLDSLSELTEVTGNLSIYNNPILTNMDGLSSLTKVGVKILVYNNASLEDVDG